MDQETGVTRVRVTASPARTEGGRSIEEIRQNIEHTRNEITDTVDQLSEKFKETFDWKAYVGDYPLVALGGATIVGFFLTRMVLGRKRSDTDELIKNLIRTGTNALKPPKKSIAATLLAFGAKYAFDKFKEHQEEQTRQLELEQQLEQLQALQLMQHQMGAQTSGYPVTNHRDS